MARTGTPQSLKTPRFILMAAICIVVAALYFAQDVLIPLALATLLTFLLSPLVQRLERWKLGRVPSVIIVVILAFGAIGVLGWVVTRQVLALARDLPVYKDNIKAKAHWLPLPNQSGGVIEKVKETVAEVNQEITRNPATTQSTQPAGADGSPLPTTQALHVEPAPRIGGTLLPQSTVPESTTRPIATVAGASARTPPMPVTVVPPEPSPWAQLKEYGGMIAGPLGTTGIVAIFVVFMLLSKEDLRNRLIRLVGYGQLTLTTQALDDAASRISRYLTAQAIVNGSYGMAIAIGLAIIGLTLGHGDPPFPNVALWGLLCGVLRFIPYIGPWIAAAFPVVLALAVYKGFGVFVAVVVMFVVVELLSNNVMEPMLYGASTGMSTIAILVSAVFWTWLWGGVGLLLATPLTVCLVVIGKYVPQLKFLDILLGDEPVLAPHERLYQRWLALDPEEATELVHQFFGERSLEQVYDEMLIPALALAEQDRHNGRLDDRRQDMIRQSLRELIDELGDEYRVRFAQTGASTSTPPAKPRDSASDGDGNNDRKRESNSGATSAAPAGQPTRATLPKDCAISVLILPAHDEADEIVGLMFAQVLEFNNYCAFAASQTALAGEMMELVESKDADVVCVSALPPSAVTHSRYLCKRLRQRYPEIKMLIGLWAFRGNIERAKQRIACDDHTLMDITLAGVLNQLEQITQPMLVRNDTTAAQTRKAKTPTLSSPQPRP